MAVVQISRIQLRRGKKNEGSGLPQLASGELAWCVDTQELYIGNGAVSEGSPAVGNTKLLTDKDSLLDLGVYSYKADVAAIQTGSDVNYPVTRSIQEKLDDRVTSADYGIESSNSLDQYLKIQRAIDNLFLDMSYELNKSRVVFEFLPGTYTFSQTLYLPSYVSIIGAGTQKTIFNYTGTGPAFVFINDTSTKTSRKTSVGIQYNLQAKFCYLKGFTINTTALDAVGFSMYCVRDSVFNNIEIIGPYGDSNTYTSSGIAMYAYSGYPSEAGVTCTRNIFNNVSVVGFNNAVFAKQDIYNNNFNNCYIKDSKQGFYLGVGSNGTTPGEEYGPRHNIIEGCYFENIDKEGIYVDRGFGNKSRSNNFVNVGNDGGLWQTNVSSIIRFTTVGNSTELDSFDRSNAYLNSQDLQHFVGNFGYSYKQEVIGKALYAKTEPRTVALTYNTSYTNLIKLPTVETMSFEINYVLESEFYTQTRRGKIVITYDSDTDAFQIADDYEYTGTLNEDTRIKFNASSTEASGSIVLQYINNNTFDTTLTPTVMTYTYSTLS